MIVWVILIVIVVIVLIAVWYVAWSLTSSVSELIGSDVSNSGITLDDSDTLNFHEYPTIHSRCSQIDVCGGDLVCDVASRRCKKAEGGACAQNVDCVKGLQCVEWICTNVT
jgi:hypothetical protein